jgi:hypothetical protein
MSRASRRTWTLMSQAQSSKSSNSTVGITACSRTRSWKTWTLTLIHYSIAKSRKLKTKTSRISTLKYHSRHPWSKKKINYFRHLNPRRNRSRLRIYLKWTHPSTQSYPKRTITMLMSLAQGYRKGPKRVPNHQTYLKSAPTSVSYRKDLKYQNYIHPFI